jgi:TolB protein
VRLEFVDVESGEVTGQTAVVPARFFIDQLLSYFDQYALSHDLWSPDSSAFLLPVRDEAGGTHVAVVYRDGRPTVALDGQAAFWSPTAD